MSYQPLQSAHAPLVLAAWSAVDVRKRMLTFYVANWRYMDVTINSGSPPAKAFRTEPVFLPIVSEWHSFSHTRAATE